MSDTDLELLARYARRQAEDAFAEIARRLLNLVYSAALRQVRSPQLAEEVAQSAFIDLARNAVRLRPDTVLTACCIKSHAAPPLMSFVARRAANCANKSPRR